MRAEVCERVKLKLLQDLKNVSDSLLNARVVEVLSQRLGDDGGDVGRKHKDAAQVRFLQLEQHLLLAHAATLPVRPSFQRLPAAGGSRQQQQQQQQEEDHQQCQDQQLQQLQLPIKRPRPEGRLHSVAGGTHDSEGWQQEGKRVCIEPGAQPMMTGIAQGYQLGMQPPLEAILATKQKPETQNLDSQEQVLALTGQEQALRNQEPQAMEMLTKQQKLEQKKLRRWQRKHLLPQEMLAQQKQDQQALLQLQEKEMAALGKQHEHRISSAVRADVEKPVRAQCKQERLQLTKQHRKQMGQLDNQQLQAQLKYIQLLLQDVPGQEGMRAPGALQQLGQLQLAHPGAPESLGTLPPAVPRSQNLAGHGPAALSSMPSILPSSSAAQLHPLSLPAPLPDMSLDLAAGNLQKGTLTAPLNRGMGGQGRGLGMPLLLAQGLGMQGTNSMGLAGDIGAGALASANAPLPPFEPSDLLVQGALGNSLAFSGALPFMPSLQPFPEEQLLLEQLMMAQQEQRLVLEQQALVEGDMQLLSQVQRQYQGLSMQRPAQRAEIQALQMKQQALLLRHQQHRQRLLHLQELQQQGELRLVLLRQQQQQQQQQQQRRRQKQQQLQRQLLQDQRQLQELGGAEGMLALHAGQQQQQQQQQQHGRASPRSAVQRGHLQGLVKQLKMQQALRQLGHDHGDTHPRLVQQPPQPQVQAQGRGGGGVRKAAPAGGVHAAGHGTGAGEGVVGWEEELQGTETGARASLKGPGFKASEVPESGTAGQQGNRCGDGDGLAWLGSCGEEEGQDSELEGAEEHGFAAPAAAAAAAAAAAEAQAHGHGVAVVLGTQQKQGAMHRMGAAEDAPVPTRQELNARTWESVLHKEGPFSERDVMAESAIRELSSCAPTWAVILDFEPPPVTSTSQHKRPHTRQIVVSAAQLLDLSRGNAGREGRKLQVQTLVAGIAAPLELVSRVVAHTGSVCHACNFRPLALLTTSIRCGMPYVPLRLAQGAQAALPPHSRAIPLGLAWAAPACLFTPSPYPPLGDRQRPKSGGGGEHDHAAQYAALLRGVPWWNVVERYNARGSWKCIKGRSIPGAEVLSLLEQGLLDEVAPVLGVQQQLHPRMWLPSSLFLPLAAVREICFSSPQDQSSTYFRYTPLSSRQLEDINKDNRLLYNCPK